MYILLFVFLLFNYNPDLKKIRYLYISSVESKANTEKLLNEVQAQSGQWMICKGYEGVANMILAKHSYNPYAKLSYFNKGKLLLEEAIAKDSLNIELRYLRYNIQENAPFFLGYNQKLDSDRTFLKNNLTAIKDEQLKQLILEIISKSK